MRVRCGRVILFGSLLGFTLVARNTQACTCAGPTGTKTMREVAEWIATGRTRVRLSLKAWWKVRKLEADPLERHETRRQRAPGTSIV
jgi:hypothetical protein